MPEQDKLGAGSARPSQRDSAQKPDRLFENRIECELVENRLLRLRGAGARVICLEGVVLITAYNQPEDIALRAGDVFIVPNGGLVLIEAIGCARLRIELPRAGARRLSARVVQMLKGFGYLAGNLP